MYFVPSHKFAKFTIDVDTGTYRQHTTERSKGLYRQEHLQCEAFVGCEVAQFGESSMNCYQLQRLAFRNMRRAIKERASPLGSEYILLKVSFMRPVFT